MIICQTLLKGLFLVLLLSFISLTSVAQQISIIPGLYFNTMFGSSEYPSGIGGVLDIDYQPKKTTCFSIALRGKYTYYSFDDNSKITIDNNGSLNNYNKTPKLKYNISFPQIAIVPKFYYDVDDVFSLYFESEFSYGFMSVNAKYLENDKFLSEKFDKYCFTVTPSIGTSIDFGNIDLIIAVGWHFVDFTSMLKDHQPTTYNESINRQIPGPSIGVSVRVPLF